MKLNARQKFAQMGGFARAKKLGKLGLEQHAHKMVEARKKRKGLKWPSPEPAQKPAV